MSGGAADPRVTSRPDDDDEGDDDETLDTFKDIGYYEMVNLLLS